MDLKQPKNVGMLLREWRKRRRLTQLDLALDAEISQRHLSFVELGRANPSREMILRLCKILEVPLREQNILLVRAGFAPTFPQRSLNDPSFAAVDRAINTMLLGFEPNPVFVIDRHWTILKVNKAGNFLLSRIDPSLLQPPINVLRIALHPKGLTPQIINYLEWREHILEYLGRQIDLTADSFLIELLAELKSYPHPDLPQFKPCLSPETQSAPVAVGLRLRSQAGIMSFIVTTTVFGTPIDITLSELAIEVFFPADVQTAQLLQRIGK